jgi:hypothetical protein
VPGRAGHHQVVQSTLRSDDGVHRDRAGGWRASDHRPVTADATVARLASRSGVARGEVRTWIANGWSAEIAAPNDDPSGPRVLCT